MLKVSAAALAVALSLILTVPAQADYTFGNMSIQADISPEEALKLRQSRGVLTVDVRTREEYEAGHLDGALLFPLDTITSERAAELLGPKDTVIVLYCRSGRRASAALGLLKDLGYSKVYNAGGYAPLEAFAERR